MAFLVQVAPSVCRCLCTARNDSGTSTPRRRQRRRIGNRFLPPPNKNLMLTNATFLFRQKRPSVQLLFFFSSLIGPSAINVPIDEYLSHSKEFCGKSVCTATLRCHIQPNSSSFHSLSGLKVKSLTGQFKKFEYSNENNYRLCRQNGLNSRPWACFVPKQRSLPLAKNRFVFHQMEMAAMMKRRH